jgi:hypothetical protein
MPRTSAPRSPRRRAWAAAPLAALTLFAVSACGSGAHHHGNSAARQAYTQCLSAHGVTLPHRTPGSGGHTAGQHRDPSVAPAGVNQQTWTSARTACASQAPTPPSTAGS